MLMLGLFLYCPPSTQPAGVTPAGKRLPIESQVLQGYMAYLLNSGPYKAEGTVCV
jgi:hypothetical protein